MPSEGISRPVATATGPRKRYGPAMLVTDEFRAALRGWLSGRDADGTRRSASGLARVVGCDASNISMLLNHPRDYETSRLVQPICRATGIALPHPTRSLTETEMEILDRIQHLSTDDPDTYAAVIALIRARTS